MGWLSQTSSQSDGTVHVWPDYEDGHNTEPGAGLFLPAATRGTPERKRDSDPQRLRRPRMGRRRMTLFGDDPAATTTRPSTPHWSAVAGRTPCDKCVAEALAARHRGDIQLTPNPARWRRVHEGTDARLCYPHAQPIRADDDRKAA